MSKELSKRDGYAGALTAQTEMTLEEVHEALLMGLQTLLRQASGIKDPKEFNLIYGKHMTDFRLKLDHLVILASQ